MTPTGWLVVRDALTIGDWHGSGPSGRAHAPADRPRRRPPAGPHGRVRPGRGAARADLRAALQLRARRRAAWTPVADEAPSSRSTPPTATTHAAAVQRPADGHRGPHRARPPHDARGRAALLRAVVDGGSSAARAPSSRPNAHIARTAHYWREWLAAGSYPDHPWREYLQRSALVLKGLTYAPTGRDDRRADHIAAGDARRRAQLGLPLLLDARRDVHALGPACARPRLGGQRLHGVPGRPRSATRTARCRSCTGSAASGISRRRRCATSRATSARGRCARATAPTTSARTTSTARCSTRSTCTPSATTTSTTGSGRCCRDQVDGRVARLAQARPGDLGGARRAQALRLLEADVLGRAGPRRAARRAARRARARESLAGRRRRDPRRHPRARASTSAACSSSTTTRRRSTPRTC